MCSSIEKISDMLNGIKICNGDYFLCKHIKHIKLNAINFNASLTYSTPGTS